jgi:hypothetical protein
MVLSLPPLDSMSGVLCLIALPIISLLVAVLHLPFQL